MAEIAQRYFDLHDCEKTVFPGFNEEVSYLERVTVGCDEAVSMIRAHIGLGPDDPEEVEPQPIYMRWLVAGDPELAERRANVPEVPCWLECEADHPDAVPFWRDSP